MAHDFRVTSTYVHVDEIRGIPVYKIQGTILSKSLALPIGCQFISLFKWIGPTIVSYGTIENSNMKINWKILTSRSNC